MLANKPNFNDYAKQEAPELLKGEKLLAPEQVCDRLGITYRQLRAFTRGENNRGIILPVYKLGSKTFRYRLADILRLEWECLQYLPPDE